MDREHIPQAYKRINLAIGNNMGGPSWYYAKWTKGIRERQMYDFTYMWNLKNQQMNKQSKTEPDS